MKKLYALIVLLALTSSCGAGKTTANKSYDRIVRYRYYVVENGRNRYLDNKNWVKADKALLSQISNLRKGKDTMIAMVYGRRITVLYNN